ncbi:hypothetical protein GGR42_003187 [Saonia flava]|uniref:Uncharacterized protein n=1 Tax=Saonia flava TaxID=523696 RepID=A0A846QUS7_9FLAO|nr:hypothetical protein [Saonia flava]
MVISKIRAVKMPAPKPNIAIERTRDRTSDMLPNTFEDVGCFCNQTLFGAVLNFTLLEVL